MPLFSREDYESFLRTEIDAVQGDYFATISRQAIDLKNCGLVHCCLFMKFDKDGCAILKLRVSGHSIRVGAYFTSVIFKGDWGKFCNWGGLKWKELVAQHKNFSFNVHCVWMSKSSEPGFLLIGVKGVPEEFADEFRKGVIVCLGPQEPPLQYLINLANIVNLRHGSVAFNSVLDFDAAESSCWSPDVVSFDGDLNALLVNGLSNSPCAVVQGPPGTGKTYRMAMLAESLASRWKRVLVTALTNRALMELAHKFVDIAAVDGRASLVSSGKVAKSALSLDEQAEVAGLLALNGNAPRAEQGCVDLASFYVSSGWTTESAVPVFDYVIVDEASQAFLPMIAAVFRLAPKAIFIGDQNQLSPISIINSDLVCKKGWQKMIRGFDTLCNSFEFPQFMLTDTFRLTSRAAHFTSLFYRHPLRSVSNCQPDPLAGDVISADGGPVLLDCPMPIGDKKPEGAIREVHRIVSRIHSSDRGASVAVLSKFHDSVGAISDYFLQYGSSNSIPDNLRIATVDSVQGMTVDYCIFFIPNSSIKLSLEASLFNVATSRATRSTVIVGDRRSLSASSAAPSVCRFLQML